MKVYAEMILTARTAQSQDALVDLFTRYGCPKGIGCRVSEDLLRDGRRKITLLASLDFVALATELASHSVRLLIHSKIKQGAREALRRVK